MSQLENQIAVVTGAGRGIGRAIALKFAAEGADVACVSRTLENSGKVAAEIRALGRRAWAHAVDVADAAAVNAAAEKILADVGRVDILVNNAGVTRDDLLMRMSEADWDAVLDTNLKGAFLFTKAFSRALLKQRSGRIINVASVIGLIGNAGQCNYAASKAGLIGFTKSVARETGLPRHHGQCAGPGIHRNGHDRGVEGGVARRCAQTNSARQFRATRRHCGRGSISGRSRGALPHGAGPGGGRRHGDVKSPDRRFYNIFWQRKILRLELDDLAIHGIETGQNLIYG